MTQSNETTPEPQLWFGDSHTLEPISDEERTFIFESAETLDTTRPPRL